MEAIEISTTYVAGQCNIGGYEVLRRRITGYFGLALTLIWAALSHLLSGLTQYRFLIFIPALVGAIGFMQARKRFCVAYGLTGMENAEGDEAAKVEQGQNRRADRAYSLRMLGQALAIALILTLVNQI